jgi:hypothetical protein
MPLEAARRELAPQSQVGCLSSLSIIPHHETFSTTIQPLYSSTKG